MTDGKHGGTEPGDWGSGVPTVRLYGVIARNGREELCFFPAEDCPEGVPLLDGMDAVMDAVLAAPEREVSHDAIRALNRDYS